MQSTFFWDQRSRRQIVGWAGSNAEVKMKKVVDRCLEMFKVEEKERGNSLKRRQGPEKVGTYVSCPPFCFL